MRSHDAERVPSYDDRMFPHEQYPPWLALMGVMRALADVLGRRAPSATLRKVEVRLFQAAKRIVELAGGRLSPAGWHRRAASALDRLGKARAAVDEYALAPVEAHALVAAIDETVVRLAEEAAVVPLPAETLAALDSVAEGGP